MWLDTKDLSFYDKKGKLRSRAKFDPRYAGPYTISRVIVPGSAYELDLGPKEFFHKVQSVSKLRPFHVSEEFPMAHDARPPASIQATDDEGVVDTDFEVEKIVAKRKFGRQWKYRVKWKGYPSRQNTWEPKSSLTHCADAIADFESR